MGSRKNFTALIVLLFALQLSSGQQYLENEASTVLDAINKQFLEVLQKKARADWLLEVSDEPETLEAAVEADDEYSKFITKVSTILTKYTNVKFQNESLERQIKRFPKPTFETLPNRDNEAITDAMQNLSSIFINIKICSYRQRDNCNLTLIPDIQDILHSTNDIEEIKYYWLEWRTATGPKNEKYFEDFVRLFQKAARINKYAKPSDMWFKDFDDNNILDEVENLIGRIHPLFVQFHAHIRYLLQQKYGPELIKSDRPYPLHLSEILLGEVYRYQEDGHVELPYPTKLIPNVTEELIRQGYTPKKLFDVSREFYQSIGFQKLSDTFWDRNTRPVAKAEERVLTCFSQAWRTYEEYKVGYSYCPEVDFRRFLNTHEAMGDIYNYLYSQRQPPIFQKDPLPNFEEVFTEPIELSVSSIKHLEKVGLVRKGSIDYKTRINKLYLKAMETLFLLPILFILDKYRIQILNGEIDSWDNCKYWALTEKYIGSVPAVQRSNDDFDAPAKLLTAVDAEYTSHILVLLMEYQVYQSLCQRVGEYIPDDPCHPLDNCDLSGYPEVGEIFSQAMSLGSSKHWREVLQVLTGQTKVDPTGFLEYFGPLIDWLVRDNFEKNVTIGWKETTTCIDNQSIQFNTVSDK